MLDFIDSDLEARASTNSSIEKSWNKKGTSYTYLLYALNVHGVGDGVLNYYSVGIKVPILNCAIILLHNKRHFRSMITSQCQYTLLYQNDCYTNRILGSQIRHTNCSNI